MDQHTHYIGMTYDQDGNEQGIRAVLFRTHLNGVYTETKPFDGLPFMVEHIISEPTDEYDADVLPVFQIRVNDDVQITAWPEEVLSDQYTWTFCGHWENDRIVVEYAIPGVVEDDRTDTGYWEQGLWAAAGSGHTIEEAQAAAIAEYEGHTCERCGATDVPDGNFDPASGLCDDCSDYNASRVVL